MRTNRRAEVDGAPVEHAIGCDGRVYVSVSSLQGGLRAVRDREIFTGFALTAEEQARFWKENALTAPNISIALGPLRRPKASARTRLRPRRRSR